MHIHRVSPLQVDLCVLLRTDIEAREMCTQSTRLTESTTTKVDKSPTNCLETMKVQATDEHK